MRFDPILHPLILVGIVAGIGILILVAFRKSPAERNIWVLRAALLLCCFALLLRPGLPTDSARTLTTNTDIILVVDNTASIIAEDWGEGEPRLVGVREDVQKIVDTYPGARFALITVGAEAELRLPVTSDTNAVISSLNVLQPEITQYSQGTSLGRASVLLSKTLAQIQDSTTERSRMVFFLSDGEQTGSDQSVPSFASSAELIDGGAVLGYGTTAGGVMRVTSGSTKDEAPEYIQYQGAPAVSVIDEVVLNQIAADLGVPYSFRSAEQALELPAAPDNTISTQDSESTGGTFELYPFIMLLILLLVGTEIALATSALIRLRAQRNMKPTPEVNA